MFIKYEIEKYSKKSLYDFLTTFLFKENIKESRYYRIFIYIYFKLKTNYFKRYKSKNKINFFFVLFSIDYMSVNKNRMINVKEFYEYLRNRLNVINFFNRANMAEFMYLLLITQTKHYNSKSLLQLKKNKRQRKILTFFYEAVHMFEYARNDDEFDFLYMKAFFKNVYDHFKSLHYQYLLPVRSRNIRPRTESLMRYLKGITPILKYFTQSRLRYSVPEIGDLVRSDPKWIKTFLLTYYENLKVRIKIRKFRELFRCRLSHFINRNNKFKIFEDVDYPLWEHLSTYVKSIDIDNRKWLFRYKRNKKRLKINKKKIQINIKNLLMFENLKVKPNTISICTYDCVDDVYEIEKDFIYNFSKNYYEIENEFQDIFKKDYKVDQELKLTDLVDQEELFVEREETLSTIGYDYYNVPLKTK